MAEVSSVVPSPVAPKLCMLNVLFVGFAWQIESRSSAKHTVVKVFFRLMGFLIYLVGNIYNLS